MSDVGTLILVLVRALVDFPNFVKVNEIIGTQAIMIEVVVTQTDHGKIIGKKGRTANAIRDLLASIGGKTHTRYILEIVE